MKELSIEEKARRYNEAIETARKINSGEGVAAPPDWTTCEVIFPELKENKDERIKKVIYGWICTQPSQFFNNGFSKEEMLTWLERQGKKELANMDKLQQIKDKLEEMKAKYVLEQEQEEYSVHSNMWWSGFFSCLREITSTIDVVEKEPVIKED